MYACISYEQWGGRDLKHRLDNAEAFSRVVIEQAGSIVNMAATSIHETMAHRNDWMMAVMMHEVYKLNSAGWRLTLPDNKQVETRVRSAQAPRTLTI